MSFRKRKGDAAEAVRQRFWEAQGALVFPISPSFAGVDLLVFHPDGRIILSEVKGQRDPLYGETKADAIRKVHAFVLVLRDVIYPSGLQVEGELVHVHPANASERAKRGQTEVLWRDPK